MSQYPRGIDLSHFQAEPISFHTLRNVDKLDFVGLKASEGATYRDRTYRDRVSRAHATGFPRILPYHFLKANIPAKVQAENFTRALVALSPRVTPVVDFEGDEWGQIDDPAQVVLDFVFHAKRALNCRAADFMLYTPVKQMVGMIGADELKQLTFMPLWVARYRSNVNLDAPDPGDVGPWGTWHCWQYTQTGLVKGFDGPVDLNVGNPDVFKL